MAIILHNYNNLSNKEIINLVKENIDFLVPKDISIEQYIARALEVSEICNSWQIGICNSESLCESIVHDIAIDLYYRKGNTP